MSTFSTLLNGIGILAGIFILLLITREIWTWFFKFNVMVKQNEEIIRLLKKIADNQTPMETSKTEENE